MIKEFDFERDYFRVGWDIFEDSYFYQIVKFSCNSNPNMINVKYGKNDTWDPVHKATMNQALNRSRNNPYVAIRWHYLTPLILAVYGFDE